MTAANPAAPTYCEACGHPSNDGERIRELEAELASEKRLYDQHLKEYWAVVKERDALKARVAELEADMSCIPCADGRHLQCTGRNCECPRCHGGIPDELSPEAPR